MAITTSQANSALNALGSATPSAPSKPSMPPRPGSTNADVVCTSHYLENVQANHYKFYWVLTSDEGHCVFAWGRIGTAGQAKIEKHPSGSDAETAGMKQAYAKAAKGYEFKEQGAKIVVTRHMLDEAVRTGNANSLMSARRQAMQDPAFKGQQEAAAKHYDDFIKSAEALMSKAATTPAALLFDDWQALQESWKELSDKHDTASTYVSMTEQIMLAALTA